MKHKKFDTELFSITISNKCHLYRISLRTAAKQIGISAPTLSRLQNKRLPDLITYQRCCKWLNVDMDFFFEDNEKPY